MKQKKVTIYDIADKAKVSVGTVHRALNNKGRISSKTKQLVLDVAESLGYKVNVAAQGLRRAPIKIGAILFCPIEEYVDHIAAGISAAGEELEKYNVSVDVKKINYTNSIDCLKRSCKQIEQFADKGYNGIVLFLSSMINEMNDLSLLANKLAKEKNISFATVANDITAINKTLHVGINASMAGSMAAEMLELSCRKKDVALLVTSRFSPINMEYIDGFINYSKDDVFSSIVIYEHYDDKEKITEVTKRMLKENPNLSGVYMATASSTFACKCIENMNVENLHIVTTDLLSETPRLLQSKVANAAIFQNPYKQGKCVVRLLYNSIITKTTAGTHLISPCILLSSNIQSYLFDDN